MDRERLRRRNLPHWDVPGAAYFVTSCLEGSIPALGLLQISRYRAGLEGRPKPAELSDAEWKVHRWKLSFVRVEEWLDSNPARRDLEDPALAAEVVTSFFHFAGERYDLLAYVVMPSHVHWLFRPLPVWVASLTDDERSPRERIVYSINRYTATVCNRLVGRKGSFWQTESYDHWVRDAEEMERIIRYIEDNPVKARLVQQSHEWRFSSAFARRVHPTERGCPLLKGRSGLES
jgi:type I restriction enzyme R subunit